MNELELPLSPRLDSLAKEIGYSKEQMLTLKNQIAKGCTDDELSLFLYQAKRTGLDPFSRQIYAIRRKSKNHETGQYEYRMTIQTAIDGFRLIAERSKKYAGQILPQYCGPDGKWVEVWLKSTPPSACKVGVLRSDFAEPLWAVATWTSYSQNTEIWRTKSDVMLAKVAEALALRKAFPQELSSLYIDDEMPVESKEKEKTEAPKPERPAMIESTATRVIEHEAGEPLAIEEKQIEANGHGGDYVPTQGPWKGRPLREQPMTHLKEVYLNKLKAKETAAKNGTSLPAEERELMKEMYAYIAETRANGSV